MPAKSSPVRKSAVKKGPAPAGKTRRAASTKSPAAPRATAKTAPRPAKKPVARHASGAKASPSPTPVARPGKKPPISLGRPKVVGEELLDLVFKEDFHARQIFVFLGVRTVRELEEFQPDQICEKASQPIRATIERIRQRLALLNRSLCADQEFAVNFLETLAREQHS